jgi:hypothetical protein
MELRIDERTPDEYQHRNTVREKLSLLAITIVRKEGAMGFRTMSVMYASYAVFPLVVVSCADRWQSDRLMTADVSAR